MSDLICCGLGLLVIVLVFADLWGRGGPDSGSGIDVDGMGDL